MLARLVENLPQLIALAALMAVSGAVSGSETALFALTRHEMARFRGAGGVAAQAVCRLRAQPRGLLSTVLLTNTAVNILLYSMLGITSVRIAGGSPILTPAFGVLGFIITLFAAEILPKQVALAARVKLAPVVALPLRMLQVATAPIRWVLENLFVEPLTRILAGTHAPSSATRADELQQLVSICESEGLVDPREGALIHRIVELSETRVSSLMVPRVDFQAFNLASDRSELAQMIRSSRLMRIPVYEGDIDKIKGVVFAKDFLLDTNRPWSDLIRPVHFIPEQAGVESLLQHFRRTGSQSAIVVDEYGGLAGIVAMEDVVEAIVGELASPYDDESHRPLERVDDRTFLVDAGVDVDDFRRAFELPLEETRIDTVGGLVGELLGRLPVQGDEVDLGHARIRVINMRKRRILRVRVTLAEVPAENPDLAVLLGGHDGGAGTDGVRP